MRGGITTIFFSFHAFPRMVNEERNAEIGKSEK